MTKKLVAEIENLRSQRAMYATEWEKANVANDACRASNIALKAEIEELRSKLEIAGRQYEAIKADNTHLRGSARQATARWQEALRKLAAK